MMTMQTVVLTAVTAVPLLGASLHTPAAPEGLEPKKTYAVIVGMLGTASAPDWDKENRKDQELFDTLARKGVPTNNMAIILDEQATRKERVRRSATCFSRRHRTAPLSPTSRDMAVQAYAAPIRKGSMSQRSRQR